MHVYKLKTPNKKGIIKVHRHQTTQKRRKSNNPLELEINQSIKSSKDNETSSMNFLDQRRKASRNDFLIA